MYKRQALHRFADGRSDIGIVVSQHRLIADLAVGYDAVVMLSLIHLSEPTRLLSISSAVFCLKKNTAFIHSISLDTSYSIYPPHTTH